MPEKGIRPPKDVCERCVEEQGPLSASQPLYLKAVCWKHLPEDERKGYWQLIEFQKDGLAGKNLRGANLERARLKRASLGAAELSHANLKETDFEETNLEGANLEFANLKGANLALADLEGANVSFAEFGDYTFWHVLFGRRQVTNCLGIKGTDALKGDPMTVRQIKDLAYAQSFQRSNPRLGRLWKYTCGYGHSFGLWLMWCALLAFAFGVAYADHDRPTWMPDGVASFFSAIDPKIAEVHEGAVKGYTSDAYVPYYYSIVTFTTLGFGDVIPLNLAGRIWVTFEVIFGYLALGGLISILATKIARRY